MDNNLLLTIIAAIILMGLVIAALAIGLLLTGKSRLKRGCGLSPDRKKKGDSSCSICGDRKDECDKDK
ncbi:MAG: hypothetical protein JJU12_03070 [Chlamydiales bacterium]|nr:hypothetical protein [Chlamydiales bacterium]